MEPNPIDLIVTNIGQLVTCAKDREDGAESALGLVEDATVACAGGKVVYAGPSARMDDSLTLDDNAERIDASGLLVTPGFVDPHTPLAFGGDRAAEFASRCAGATYLEILQAGGGILATVRATRATSEESLVGLCVDRLHRFAMQGVTTVEVKSGYGLTIEEELKLLRAIARAAKISPVRVVATLLGAHALSDEYREKREHYVSLVCRDMIPAAAESGLARFTDVFVEEGAFTAQDARAIARSAMDHGLGLRMHVDQLTAGGGAELAADLGALSADHLEQVSPDGVKALAKSGVCAGLLPTATLYARLKDYAPGRALSDAGAILALGTNYNPGSAMTENHSLALGLACLQNGLTPAEALLAATDGAARSLNLHGEVGLLTAGSRADLIIHKTDDYRHLAFHLATSHAAVVVAAGKVIHRAEPILRNCPG